MVCTIIKVSVQKKINYIFWNLHETKNYLFLNYVRIYTTQDNFLPISKIFFFFYYMLVLTYFPESELITMETNLIY